MKFIYYWNVECLKNVVRTFSLLVPLVWWFALKNAQYLDKKATLKGRTTLKTTFLK